jgi:hypothetical protein
MVKMNSPAAPRQTSPKQTSLVSLLVWVYRDQLAHLNSHLTLTMPIHTDRDHSASSPVTDWGRLERQGHLGAHIPSTHDRHRAQLHPDAEGVHAALTTLSRADAYGAHLLARHALTAQPPDYCDDVPQPEPVMRLDDRGRDRIVDDACLPGNGSVERSVTIDPATGVETVAWVEIPYRFCPIRYWPSPADIAQSRLDYRIWHRALTRLSASLPPLKSWRVNGLGAPGAPWDVAGTVSPRRRGECA